MPIRRTDAAPAATSAASRGSAWWPLAVLLAGLATTSAVAAVAAGDPEGDPAAGPAAGFVTILEKDIEADVRVLASPELEGRDSPSEGLSRAADHIAARLAAAGFKGVGKQGSFRLPFTRRLPTPVAASCSLAVTEPAEAAHTFVLGEDFVPVAHTAGSARGEAVLLGFGIDSEAEDYDDVRGELAERIAVIIEGEPRHKRKFEGPEVTADADLFAKLKDLREAKLAGVLVVRRPIVSEAAGKAKADSAGTPAYEQQPPQQRPSFRFTWASWAGEGAPVEQDFDFPVLEISPAAAAAILGIDVLDVAAKVDASGKPPKRFDSGRVVALSAGWAEEAVPIDNVVGLLAGSDQALANQYVVVGAHYDHVGVDSRGRIGCGADDNASGTAALLEVAAALAANPPRRSILACAFAAEEDGLIGSQALCDELPVPKDSLVAMINMDMVGRGERDEVAVLGLIENPELEAVLQRARKLQNTRITKLVLRQGEELFARSDHYSFHRIGVPVLFFFEGVPIEKNKDYHTWRDTIDKLDLDKITRTARLVYNTTWLLATDDERPPPPEKDTSGH